MTTTRTEGKTDEPREKKLTSNRIEQQTRGNDKEQNNNKTKIQHITHY